MWFHSSDHVVCNLTSELNEIPMPIWSDYFSIRNSLSSDYLHLGITVHVQCVSIIGGSVYWSEFE